MRSAKRNRTTKTGTFVLGALALACAIASGADAEVRFNRDVLRILSDNCFVCHGPDAKQRKAKLRLDVREEAVTPAESGDTPVVPGKPGQSALVARIESSDGDDVMPPPKSHKHLTAAQKDLLKRWIAEGAKFERHLGVHGQRAACVASGERQIMAVQRDRLFHSRKAGAQKPRACT